MMELRLLTQVLSQWKWVLVGHPGSQSQISELGSYGRSSVIFLFIYFFILNQMLTYKGVLVLLHVYASLDHIEAAKNNKKLFS